MPLPEELREETLRHLASGVENLEKAEAITNVLRKAGVPVTEMETRNAELRERLMRFKGAVEEE